jgi:hypothetical protein
MEFQELLKKIVEILEDLDINYCITGGFAVSVWGRPRSTFDIDVVIQLKDGNIKPLIKNLRRLSSAGYIEESAVKEAAAQGGEFNFIHPESGIKADFWVIKKGDLIGQKELKRRVVRNFDGQKIYFISPEDLILSKLRWFKESESSRHLEDVKSILKISGKKIDSGYLKSEAKKQGNFDILFSQYNLKLET